MRVWIGKSIVIIGVIHSIFGFVFFRSTIAELFGDGLINTVNGQPMREAVFWFIFAGFLMILFGMLVDWCERKGLELPKFLGWSLLIFTISVVTIMPISGGWLMFIPAIGAIIKTHNSKQKILKANPNG